MNFAEVAKSRSNCLRRNVGAVLVKDNHIIATGYNGTPVQVRNCTEGGCDRCLNTKSYPVGRDYDLCLCVHSEANTILQSARLGNAVEDGRIYTTLQPCLTCLKECINAGISGVIYLESWTVPLEQKEAYDRMTKMLDIFKQYCPPVSPEINIRHAISTQV